MILGFYATCSRHDCGLEVDDYDLSLKGKKYGVMTRWAINISGWYCPIGTKEMKAFYDTHPDADPGSYTLSCERAWWLTQ